MVQFYLYVSQSKSELLPPQNKTWIWPDLGWVMSTLCPDSSPQGHTNVNLKAGRRAPIRDKEKGSSTGLSRFMQPQKCLAQHPARSAPATGTSVLSSWLHSFA